jgi:hypothetical protein
LSISDEVTFHRAAIVSALKSFTIHALGAAQLALEQTDSENCQRHVRAISQNTNTLADRINKLVTHYEESTTQFRPLTSESLVLMHEIRELVIQVRDSAKQFGESCLAEINSDLQAIFGKVASGAIELLGQIDRYLQRNSFGAGQP